MNFAAMSALDFAEIKLVNIKNPNVIRTDCWFGVKIFQHDGTVDVANAVQTSLNAGGSKDNDVGTVVVIEHSRVNVLLDIRNDVGAGILLNHPYNT